MCILVADVDYNKILYNKTSTRYNHTCSYLFRLPRGDNKFSNLHYATKERVKQCLYSSYVLQVVSVTITAFSRKVKSIDNLKVLDAI